MHVQKPPRQAGKADSLLGVMLFGLLFGAEYGAITGAALIWLLGQSSSGDVNGLATVQ